MLNALQWMHALASRNRRWRRAVLISLLLALCCTLGADRLRAAASPPQDILLVLDNSGSMKRHDPALMVKKAVTRFIKTVPPNARVGVMMFAQGPEVTLPLTTVARLHGPHKVPRFLQRINYRGKFTDSAAAVERALGELQQQGRRGAHKRIVLLTDGIMDVGNRAKDAEKLARLQETLTEKSRQSGIPIFGIALTDEADLTLIRTLGQQTGGKAYRAATAGELDSIFQQVRTDMTRIAGAPLAAQSPVPDSPAVSREPLPVPTPAVAPSFPLSVEPPPGAPAPDLPPAPVPGPSMILPPWLLPGALGLVFLALLLLMSGLVLTLRQLRTIKRFLAALPPWQDDQDIVPAELRSLNRVTGQKTYKLSRRINRIGREGREGLLVSINAATVSDPHAEIRYVDGHYYLVDLDSSNGTYLNNSVTRLPKFTAVPLSDGHVVAFDEFKFEFRGPRHGNRGNTQIRNVPVGPTPPAPSGSAQPTTHRTRPAGFAVDAAHSRLGKSLLLCTVHKIMRTTLTCSVCLKPFCLLCFDRNRPERVCHACSKTAN